MASPPTRGVAPMQFAPFGRSTGRSTRRPLHIAVSAKDVGAGDQEKGKTDELFVHRRDEIALKDGELLSGNAEC